MNRRILVAGLLALIATANLFARELPVPTNRFLVHLFPPWQRISKHTRTVAATIVQLFPDGRYEEHSCYLIQQVDHTITISVGDGHAVAVGVWRKNGNHFIVTRQLISREVQFYGGPDPLCSPVTYELLPNAIRLGNKRFEELRGLAVPDWDSYLPGPEGSISCGT
jgi:hypothetical protein